MRVIRVQADPFEGSREADGLSAERTDIGAVVAFTGFCRDENGALEALELEHYPGMAEDEMARIAAEAERRWPVDGIVMIHRCGLIRPGEPIVFVATASRHRAAAFAATEFLMDYLKTDAPFWKREHRRAAPSDPRAPDSWVAAKTSDDVAADRWKDVAGTDGGPSIPARA